MAYSAANHEIFSQRVQNWMLSFQNLRDEAAKLDAIFLNEAASGTDPAWGDSLIALAAEHVDAVTMFRDLKSFAENSAVLTTDRQVWITPFVQGIP